MTLKSIFCLNRFRETDGSPGADSDKTSGIDVKNWFWAAAQKIGGPRRNVKQSSKAPKVPKSPKPKQPKAPRPAHTKTHSSTHPMLAEACSRVLGRSKALSRKECVSGSTNSANLVKSKESKIQFEVHRFLESSKQVSDPTVFRVVLLEEGLGNLHDAYYYTREALESAVPVFTGLKIYADHPSLEEEEIRPERSTRDILGHYENLSVEDGDQGRAWLCGDLNIMETADCEWARGLMVRAIENAKKFPDMPFIGLSINAGGDAEKTPIDDVIKDAPDGAKEKLIEAKDSGIDLVKVVQKISRGTSCDLVTEAGAGGKIHNIIGENQDGKEKAG